MLVQEFKLIPFTTFLTGISPKTENWVNDRVSTQVTLIDYKSRSFLSDIDIYELTEVFAHFLG